MGHCFGLQHNENDTNPGLDLMVSYYTHYHWVKESNKEIVRNHFRYDVPLTPLSVDPSGSSQFEVVY